MPRDEQAYPSRCVRGLGGVVELIRDCQAGGLPFNDGAREMLCEFYQTLHAVMHELELLEHRPCPPEKRPDSTSDSAALAQRVQNFGQSLNPPGG